MKIPKINKNQSSTKSGATLVVTAIATALYSYADAHTSGMLSAVVMAAIGVYDFFRDESKI
jgi:hypothetical protein